MHPAYGLRNLKSIALSFCVLIVALGLTYALAHSYRRAHAVPEAGAPLVNSNAPGTEDWQKAPAPTPTPNIPDLVQFPNAETELIAGPQLKANSALNPFPLFDSIASSRGLLNAQAFPSVPPIILTGKLNATRGSTVVTGVGTRFAAQIDPFGPAPLFNGRLRIRDADGSTMRVVQVASVQSDSQLTLTTPWPFQSVSNSPADTYYQDNQEGWNFDSFINRNYYDLALCLYIQYYRSGDDRFLLAARRIADAWWKASFCKEGTERLPQNWLPPRSISLGGLMLRALDGRPEMWDWINTYVRYQFNHVVMEHVNDTQFYAGARESGYLLLYAAWLAKVMPDSYPLASGAMATDGTAIRAAYLSNIETAALKFYTRVQYADGSWRWDDPYQSEPDGGTLKMTMQPFMVGLLLEGMVAVHRVTQNSTVKAAVQNSIVRACENLFNVTYRKDEAVADMPAKRWRSQWYYYYGGTTVNLQLYAQGGSDAGARIPTEVKGDVGLISSQRQLNSTVQHVFGYAYRMTGEEKYRMMGEEMMDAGFGNSDGVMGMADSNYSQPKAYAMNYRAAGKFLAWRINFEALRAGQGRASVAGQAGAGSSEELVSGAFRLAQGLATSPSAGRAQVSDLINRIEAAQRALEREKGRLAAPDKVSAELRAAADAARTALRAIDVSSSKSSDNETARLRLEWAAARLKRARELLKPAAH